MPQEIERQWLLRRLPEGLGEGIEIIQGYLAVADPEVRVRRKNGRFYLTQKRGRGLTRDEGKGDVAISADAFDILWPLTAGRRIRKIRYRLDGASGLTWEIDEYLEYLRPLVVAELEVPDESTEVLIPCALRALVIREVTDDPNYQDKNLAARGVPQD